MTDRNEKLYLNLSGNSGMATAGSGDVLSGIIAAVLCMYLSCEEEQELSYKAAMAVYIHGLCGDIAREQKRISRHDGEGYDRSPAGSFETGRSSK